MIIIPVHRLQDKTDIGFQLKSFDPEDDDHIQSEALGAHRDDYYVFFLLLKGAGSAVVDFKEKTVGAGHLYYILPEQIHYRIKTTKAEGWFIAADPSLIDTRCRDVFESWSGFQEPIALSDPNVRDYDQLLSIIYRKKADHSVNDMSITVLHSLLRGFFEMAANDFRMAKHFESNNSRHAELSLKFKNLLNSTLSDS
jgi:AraC family transcriptional activator of pobA